MDGDAWELIVKQTRGWRVETTVHLAIDYLSSARVKHGRHSNDTLPFPSCIPDGRAGPCRPASRHSTIDVKVYITSLPYLLPHPKT